MLSEPSHLFYADLKKKKNPKVFGTLSGTVSFSYCPEGKTMALSAIFRNWTLTLKLRHSFLLGTIMALEYLTCSSNPRA